MTLHDHLSNIQAAALQAVDPYPAVQHHMTRTADSLYIAGRTWDLNEVARIIVIAVGKAAVPMARAATATDRREHPQVSW